ncbi:MAG: hypothetical protein II697_05815, partial [Clostridia bacterium]|nr:hypothetical protein [Clostridia bacterium]
MNESPVGFQSRGALRKSTAQTTGTNNRFLSVFAPGNFRRSFSKNCDPIAHTIKPWRFDQKTNPGQPNHPIEMNRRFISIEGLLSSPRGVMIPKYEIIHQTLLKQIESGTLP